jgi:hypothetical protein
MTIDDARSFKELRVYQKAREVSRAVFQRSKSFLNAKYSFTDQVRGFNPFYRSANRRGMLRASL